VIVNMIQKKCWFFLLFSLRFLVILDLNSEINCDVFGREAASLFCGCTQLRTVGDPTHNCSVSQPSAFSTVNYSKLNLSLQSRATGRYHHG